MAHVRSWALRAWCWPGNTSDYALIRQVKGDLRGCSLSKVVWVADCGFSSAENRRGWRDLKQVIDLRPVYHRKEERIRAHVILCWLALLLARIAENACGATWPELRRQLDRITVGTFTGPAGTFRQRTEITPAQAAILEQLGIDPPPRIYQLTPAATG